MCSASWSTLAIPSTLVCLGIMRAVPLDLSANQRRGAMMMFVSVLDVLGLLEHSRNSFHFGLPWNHARGAFGPLREPTSWRNDDVCECARCARPPGALSQFLPLWFAL